MPTDPTPRDADETLALPVTDDATATTADDDTTVLPVDERGPAADDTAVLVPSESEPTIDDTAVLTLDEPEPPARTSAWSAQGEPAPYTSPIGALYTPADRPAPDPVTTPAPVVEPAPTDPPRRRLRVGTVVWGLVIAAIGVGLLAWAAGFAIDLQLAMIVLLAVAGTALLVGSIVSGARAARR